MISYNTDIFLSNYYNLQSVHCELFSCRNHVMLPGEIFISLWRSVFCLQIFFGFETTQEGCAWCRKHREITRVNRSLSERMVSEYETSTTSISEILKIEECFGLFSHLKLTTTATQNKNCQEAFICELIFSCRITLSGKIFESYRWCSNMRRVSISQKLESGLSARLEIFCMIRYPLKKVSFVTIYSSCRLPGIFPNVSDGVRTPEFGQL